MLVQASSKGKTDLKAMTAKRQVLVQVLRMFLSKLTNLPSNLITIGKYPLLMEFLSWLSG